MTPRPVHAIVQPTATINSQEGSAMEQTWTSDLDFDFFPEEELRLQAWRRKQLRRLGVPHRLADVSAEVVDWHEIAALVDRGCPPELALEIVR
jgi:hypothetical protein